MNGPDRKVNGLRRLMGLMVSNGTAGRTPPAGRSGTDRQGRAFIIDPIGRSGYARVSSGLGEAVRIAPREDPSHLNGNLKGLEARLADRAAAGALPCPAAPPYSPDDALFDHEDPDAWAYHDARADLDHWEDLTDRWLAAVGEELRIQHNTNR